MSYGIHTARVRDIYASVLAPMAPYFASHHKISKNTTRRRGGILTPCSCTSVQHGNPRLRIGQAYPDDEFQRKPTCTSFQPKFVPNPRVEARHLFAIKGSAKDRKTCGHPRRRDVGHRRPRTPASQTEEPSPIPDTQHAKTSPLSPKLDFPPRPTSHATRPWKQTEIWQAASEGSK